MKDKIKKHMTAKNARAFIDVITKKSKASRLERTLKLSKGHSTTIAVEVIYEMISEEVDFLDGFTASTLQEMRRNPDLYVAPLKSWIANHPDKKADDNEAVGVSPPVIIDYTPPEEPINSEPTMVQPFEIRKVEVTKKEQVIVGFIAGVALGAMAATTVAASAVF